MGKLLPKLLNFFRLDKPLNGAHQYVSGERAMLTLLSLVSSRWMAVGLMSLGLIGSGLSPAQAAHINCGDVLGPGGRFVLDADLSCPNPDPDEEPWAGALTVVGPVEVDLQGHAVSC